MEVKAGYRQTDLGQIPKEWTLNTIGDVAKFSGGAQPDRSFFIFAPKSGYIRLVQIRDYKSDDFTTYIPTDLAKKRCTAQDIMIGRYGPPNFQILRGIEGAYNVALIKVIPTHIILREYFYYFLKAEKLFKLMDMLSQRSAGQDGLELPFLKAYPIPLPPLPEQHVIATALSDVDALIISLDKLIAKKRDIKQAAMQDLLTGKRRLPGFTGEVEVTPIGEFTGCTSGGTPSTTVPSYWGGDIRWMNSGELNLKIVKEVDGRITKKGLENSSTRIIPVKCVLVGLAGQGKTRGTVAMNLVELCTNQSIAAIFPSSAFVPEYLYYNLDSRYNEIRSLSTDVGGRGGLNLTIIKSIPVPLPDIQEQTAIATILSDMDADITALEQKRDKTKAIKQGMMQELLTGRIRLV